MEMPRAFSSLRRSVSTPVSARTRVVLPWSMWPAVPMIMRSSSGDVQQRQLFGEGRLVGCLQAAQVQPQSVVMQPADDGAGQAAQAGLQPGELAAGLATVGRMQAQAPAGQGFHGEGGAAGLAVPLGGVPHQTNRKRVGE